MQPMGGQVNRFGESPSRLSAHVRNQSANILAIAVANVNHHADIAKSTRKYQRHDPERYQQVKSKVGKNIKVQDKKMHKKVNSITSMQFLANANGGSVLQTAITSRLSSRSPTRKQPSRIGSNTERLAKSRSKGRKQIKVPPINVVTPGYQTLRMNTSNSYRNIYYNTHRDMSSNRITPVLEVLDNSPIEIQKGKEQRKQVLRSAVTNFTSDEKMGSSKIVNQYYTNPLASVTQFNINEKQNTVKIQRITTQAQLENIYKQAIVEEEI